MAPTLEWLTDNPWRVDMARTTIDQLAPRWRDQTISRTDEVRLLADVDIVATREGLHPRQVWLRDVAAEANWQRIYAEQAVVTAATRIVELAQAKINHPSAAAD